MKQANTLNVSNIAASPVVSLSVDGVDPTLADQIRLGKFILYTLSPSVFPSLPFCHPNINSCSFCPICSLLAGFNPLCTAQEYANASYFAVDEFILYNDTQQSASGYNLVDCRMFFIPLPLSPSPSPKTNETKFGLMLTNIPGDTSRMITQCGGNYRISDAELVMANSLQANDTCFTLYGNKYFLPSISFLPSLLAFLSLYSHSFLVQG